MKVHSLSRESTNILPGNLFFQEFNQFPVKKLLKLAVICIELYSL